MIDLSNVLPGWRAVEKIGEGSYGKVYRCVNDNTFGISDECAVKIISIPTNENEIKEVWSENPSEQAFKRHFREIVENFANEIKMMLTLNGSPNVVTIRSYKIVERQNQIGWDIYICMDYLKPFSPFTKHSSLKSFSDEEMCKFGIDICSALEVCSKYGIIHRDIKPDNIFIDKFGNYRLGDFGVARQLENSTLSMTRIGTMRYMAPEVYDGRKYDARADIYSLGMVMYKLLNNGRDPLTDPHKEYLTDKEVTSASEMRRRGAKLPPPCNASRELARIILKACEFNPDSRYSSAKEFKKDLERFAASCGEEPTQVSAAPIISASDYAPIDTTPVPPKSVLNPPHTSTTPPQTPTNPPHTSINPPQTNIRPPYTPPVPPVQQRRTTGQPPMPPVPTQRPVPPQRQVQQPVPPPQKNKSGKVGVIIAVILSILALIAIGVCIVLFVINKNNDSTDTTATTAYTQQEKVPEIEIFTNTPNDNGSDENSIYADYYKRAGAAYERGDYAEAAVYFGKAGDYKNADESSKVLWEYLIKDETVSAGYDHTVAIKNDGRVVATGSNQYGQCNVSGWSNIVSVSAGSGHTVALRADGTVVATGWNKDGQCNVGSWRDIVAVSAGGVHTIGLKKDGTVVATGFSNNGRCNVSGWDEIYSISAGSDHSVGLRIDGSVVAVGYNGDSQCNVSSWRNIKSISSGTEHTVGLTENGTVVVAGNNRYGECDVGNWNNVRTVMAKHFHTIAIRNDGSILATGLNDAGQNNISNVSYVNIATGWSHTVILLPNGTVKSIGSNEFGQCNTDSWTNIRIQ